MSPLHALVALVLATGLVSGCTRDASSDAAPTEASAAATAAVAPASALSAIDDGAVVIDVRTPEEYFDGHLRDAVNIGLADDDFEQRIGELDPSASYVVYCASGNRAGRALVQMLDLGFTDVVNGGGFEELAAAGAPVA